MKLTMDTTIYNMTVKEILDEVDYRDGDYIALSYLIAEDGRWRGECVRLGDEIVDNIVPCYRVDCGDAHEDPKEAHIIENEKHTLNIVTGDFE